MQNNIKIKIGNVADFEQLANLNYENTENKVFSLSKTEYEIKLSEEELEQPLENKSDGYQNEIKDVMMQMLTRDGVIPLVARLDNELAGYLMAFSSISPLGRVIILFGVLVASKYTGCGIGKALVEELKNIGSKDSNYYGIQAEMATDKYSASKLLLISGFVFSGAELYIYSNNEPSKFSKECIHFYYKF